MKLGFKFTGEQVARILALHVIKEQGWENDICSWEVSADLFPGQYAVWVERIPVRLQSIPEVHSQARVPSESDGRGEDR